MREWNVDTDRIVLEKVKSKRKQSNAIVCMRSEYPYDYVTTS